jgi:hypothetical protein
VLPAQSVKLCFEFFETSLDFELIVSVGKPYSRASESVRKLVTSVYMIVWSFADIQLYQYLKGAGTKSACIDETQKNGGGRSMLIQVSYTDDKYDFVKDFMLETLLASGSIAKFRRTTGWVQVGVDPIRKARPSVPYSGPDRRAS